MKNLKLFWYYPGGDAYVIKEPITTIPSIDRINIVECIDGSPSATEVHVEGVNPYTVEEYHQEFCQNVEGVWFYRFYINGSDDDYYFVAVSEDYKLYEFQP